MGQGPDDAEQTLQALDSFGPFGIVRVCSDRKWGYGGEGCNHEPSRLGGPTF